MLLCFSCITDLCFGTQIARETKRKGQSLQQCKFLTDNNIQSSLYTGYILFTRQGHQKIIEVMMLIQIVGESVRFIRSKSI